MEYSRRYISTNSKRNTTGTQEKEIQTNYPYSNQQQPSKKKHKNCRYKKPNFPITNLSNHQLSKDEINLLSKGLNFIPTLEETIQQKCSKIYFFLIEESDLDITSQIQQTKPKDHNNQLVTRYYNPAQAGPPVDKTPS